MTEVLAQLPGISRLDGKVILVTGGANGIGLETAQCLARHGATPIIADLDGDAAGAAAAAIGGNALGLRVDVESEAEISAMIGTIITTFGRIDAIYNNATAIGVRQREGDRDVANLEAEYWDRAMAVNARGPMMVSKHAIPHMIAGGGGSIIHASSGFGVQGDLTLTSMGRPRRH